MEDTQPKPTKDEKPSQDSEENSKDTNEIKTVKDNLTELRQANDEIEQELLRKEELRSKIQLGGMSETGQPKPKPKEETDKEYSDRIDEEIREGKFNG